MVDLKGQYIKIKDQIDSAVIQTIGNRLFNVAIYNVLHIIYPKLSVGTEKYFSSY